MHSGNHDYYVYILTNANKNVYYIGVTNSLEIKISQHKADALGPKKTFAGKFNCYYLIYMEHFKYINNAIACEKELKGWTRGKKEELIKAFNPDWKFLNLDW